MRFVKRVNDRGTMTLPAEIREVLGVEEGDIVEMEVVRIVRKSNPTDGGFPEPVARLTSKHPEAPL